MTTETLVSEANAHTDPSPGAPADSVAERSEQEISLLDLLIVVAVRKRLVFIVTAIFAILAIVISLTLPVRYTAMVTLLPPQQGSSMSAALASQLGNLGGMAALAGGSLGSRAPTTCSSPC